MPRALTAAIILLGLTGSFGCSEPPAKERHQAEGALAAARAADAAIYAPAELQAAEAALEQYDAAVAQRDYRLALSHAIEARDLAYEAASQASDRKSDARSAAERLSVNLEGLIATAETRLNGSGRLPADTAAALRAALSDARSAMQEARAAMDAHAYAEAADRLADVTEPLTDLLTP